MLTRPVCTIAALLLSALAVAGIPTGILYDNLDNSTQTSLSVGAVGPLYDSFSTGPSGRSLEHVQLKFQIAGPIVYRPPAAVPLLLPIGYWKPVAEGRAKAGSGLHPRSPSMGSFRVALYADNSTQPGSQLAVIGTAPDTSLSLSAVNYDFPLNAPYPLSTNQRYWIGVSTDNGSIAGWAVAQDDTGFGVADEFWYASGAVHPNTDPPFQMQVFSIPQNIAAAPSPSSLLLLLVGLAAAGVYINSRAERGRRRAPLQS